MSADSAPDAHLPATGTQYVISGGGARAVIGSLGGALRSYEVAGVQLMPTYPDADIPPSACGVLLAPWPNRIRDGRWVLEGETQQLDITEPGRGHASHGLLRNTGYTAVEELERRVSLQAEIFAQHGYPFHLLHRVDYSLEDDGGLRVRQTLRNLSARRAPFALGAHPFVQAGTAPTADLDLTVRAGTVLTVDERLIPVGAEPVRGETDLRGGRRVGDLDIDSAYTDLELDGGRHRHELRAPDGSGVVLWTSPEFGYVHVFVTDRFPGQPKAVALEPMTAPANAFNSGEGLRWLEPGEEFSAEWGITAEGAGRAG